MSPAFPECETLLLKAAAGRLYVTFNRPERRNAMNDRMIVELNQVVDQLSGNAHVRAVIFRGADRNFCAGGDIKERRAQTDRIRDSHLLPLSLWERAKGEGPHSHPLPRGQVPSSPFLLPEGEGSEPSALDARLSLPGDPVRERNRTAGRLFQKISRLPQTTVACVEGAAMGGGFGLACVMDITLVDADAKLGMPETTLGIAPAQIAPHVVRRIGLTKARHLALTGARIDGIQAHALGIAQYLFHGADDGERQLEAVLSDIERCGPQASAATKEIMRAVERLSEDELIEFAAEWFTRLNQGEEGREGQQAFVEKRHPKWPKLDR